MPTRWPFGARRDLPHLAGAYVLTEPATFWRGRLAPAELRQMRERLAEPDPEPGGGGEAGEHARTGGVAA